MKIKKKLFKHREKLMTFKKNQDIKNLTFNKKKDNAKTIISRFFKRNKNV